MKKLCLLLGLAVAAGFNSCSRDLGENPDSAPQGNGTHSLKASIAPGKPETRTSLGEKDEDKGSTPLLWTKGDQIAVVNDAETNNAFRYILDENCDGNTEGTFTVESGEGVKDASSITAYYPYSLYQGSNLTIPAAQIYKAGRTMDTNTLPMYAHSSGNDVGKLDFQPVAGVINLQLVKNGSLQASRIFYSIKLVSSADNLAGKGTIQDNAKGGKVLKIPEGSESGQSKVIEYSLGGGITFTETPTPLIFVVPAGEYAAGTLKFVMTFKDNASDTETQTVELPIRAQLTVPCGHIVNFTATQVGLVEKAESPSKVAEILESAAGNPESVPDVIEVAGITSSGEQKIELPTIFNEGNNDKPLTLAATDVAQGATIVVAEKTPSQGSSGTTVQKYVTVDNQSENTANLKVTLPNSTVTVVGKFENVTAETADQTLIVQAGAEIGTLTVNKGSVKLYGKVQKLVTGAGWNGEIIRCIATQGDLENALADKESGATYALIEKEASALDGKGGTLTLPLFVRADASLSHLTIKPDEKVLANGVTVQKDSISLTLNGVDIFVSSNDADSGLNTGILVAGVNNVMVDLKDCHIVVPKGFQRGINLHSATTPGTTTVNLDNTHIGPTLDPQTADYSQDTYTAEQINAFKSRVDSRGISFGQHTGNYVVNMKNGSVIEGVFYAVNFTYYASPAEMNIDHSILDGRCAFNIWANGQGAKINVTNGSKLVGRNYFPGPTEVFANIVLESKANGQAAENNIITVRDSEFHCFNEPQTNTNWQYAADMRSEGTNTLQLLGSTKIYDHSGRLDEGVIVRYWSNKVVADPTVSFAAGKEGATVLPSHVWNGHSYSIPGKSLDGKYYIGTPDQLAALTLQAIEEMDIVLVRDLDLDNHPWLAKYPTGTAKANNIDGGGHTIYNLNTATKGWDTKAECAGLFSAFAGTLKDLTVENATVYGSRSGALMGRLDFGTVTNCHVKNVVFTGGAQKMGGLIGFVNGQGDVTIQNCSVESGKIVKDPSPKDDQGSAVTGDASCQAGGFIGYILSANHTVSIRNNTVKNMAVESGKNYDTMDQCASHEFIGNISNNKWTTSAFVLTDNVIENSTCDATHHANRSDFLGFCYPTGWDTKNDVSYSPVTVDGTALTVRLAEKPQ